MHPDPALLRDFVTASPAISVPPGRGRPEAAIHDAEAAVGPLPASYRWWLAEYGEGTVNGGEIATVLPPAHADAPENIANRRTGDRLWFYDEGDDGDTYAFALDQWQDRERDQSRDRDQDRHENQGQGPGRHRECAVVRRDHITGDEEPAADSFAGFLTVLTARHLGLRDGPNPSVARLWRRTPGLLLPDGVHLYGPQAIGERNETYEVGRYAPHWVLVGDDSGGGGLFMRRHGKDRAWLHHLDLGALTDDGAVEADGTRLTDDLPAWLRAGAPLPDR